MVISKIIVPIFVFGLVMLTFGSGAKMRRKNPVKPDYFPVCYRNDPELSKCLLNASDYVRPYLAKGIPELRLPTFEPFQIPQIELAQGTSALNFKAVLHDVIAHGLTRYKFHRFDFDVSNYEFFCEAKIPGVVLEGDYSVSGRILIAPIEGKGKFKAEIDSCDVYVYQKYKEAVLPSDNKIHLVPTLTNSSIQVQKPRIRLEGLFNGNQELNEATNKAINDNVDELFAELKPVVETTLSKIMEDLLLKSIINNIPWDELYPVNPKFS
ncbi:protein takeout-like [Anthonomus grandis grandis]|uniref:protein takeout-like n=1 Tax=Anthonomus grandis grandis TaxID=2921223 RepID=UPI0021655A45|nr:protein takeout-like [Anthonomus grandis grandis]